MIQKKNESALPLFLFFLFIMILLITGMVYYKQFGSRLFCGIMALVVLYILHVIWGDFVTYRSRGLTVPFNELRGTHIYKLLYLTESDGKKIGVVAVINQRDEKIIEFGLVSDVPPGLEANTMFTFDEVGQPRSVSSPVLKPT